MRLTSNKSESNAILDALMRSQAYIEFKPEGTIISANDNFLGAMGYSLSEIKGQHHSMFVEPGYARSSEYKDFWSALARGEFFQAEYMRIAERRQGNMDPSILQSCL